MTDWFGVTRRNARCVQTTIGWIFWDPSALEQYAALGLPGPLGYIASRAAPLEDAGPEAVIAAFGSIDADGIRFTFDLAAGSGRSFRECWDARDEAVLEGLVRYAPAIVDPLIALGPPLWEVVDRLPRLGRTFFGAHLAMARPADPLLSGWHAVNCIREWRGDTHWALVAAAGLDGPQASILHNAFMAYDGDWLAASRGIKPEAIDAGWAGLEARGLARDRRVTAEGLRLREHLEDETDRLTATVWQLLGEERALRFPIDFEPPCAQLLARVDETAGPNYQPASRVRPARTHD
ncbi:MAG: SCO6745 family protein [Actinomycetes bacterium]